MVDLNPSIVSETVVRISRKQRGMMLALLLSGLLVGYVAYFHLRVSGMNALVLIPDPTALRPRGFCLLNPLRERGPEQAAEAVLQKLREREVDVLLPLLPADSDDTRQHVLAAERKYPILSWRIANWEDKGQGVWLSYWVKRGGFAEAQDEEEVFFEVQQQAGREWSLKLYRAVY